MGSTSWPKVTSVVRGSKTQSVSADRAGSEMYYACTFCRTEVFPSHFTWRITFRALGNGEKMERMGDSEKQETGALTVLFPNASSTINGMCKQKEK